MKKVHRKMNPCSRCGSAARVGTVQSALGETLYYVKCAASCEGGFTRTDSVFIKEEAISLWNSSYGRIKDEDERK